MNRIIPGSSFLTISSFSLIDFNTRTRRETEAETERIRTSQTAAERALEGREKAHRARVKGLEEQVSARGEKQQRPLFTVVVVVSR